MEMLTRYARWVARSAVMLTMCGAVLLASATAASAVSMTTDGNGVIIAAEGTAQQGTSHTLNFYWAPNGSTTWTPETVQGPGVDSPPSMTTDGNGIIIAAEGPSNSLYFYWALNGSSNWASERLPGSTAFAPSIATDGNNVIIAAEAPDNSLWFYWVTNGWSNWHAQEVAGPGTTYSAPSMTTDSDGTNTGVIISAEGRDNTLNFYSELNSSAFNGATNWPAQTLPGNAYSAPSLTTDGTGANTTVVVSAEGAYNSLYSYRAPIDTQTWTPKQVGYAWSAPSSTPDGSNVLISAQELSNSLNFYWGNPNIWYAKQVNGSYSTGSPTPPADGDGVTSVTTDGYGVILAAVGYNNSLDFYWAPNVDGPWTPEIALNGAAPNGSVLG